MNIDNKVGREGFEELHLLKCVPPLPPPPSLTLDLPTLGVGVEGWGGGQVLTKFTQAPHAGVDITGGLPVHLLPIVHSVHHLHRTDLLV